MKTPESVSFPSAAATNAAAHGRSGLSPAWWGLIAVCGGLLFLRKPWALHTPQLWAEDGSIFLVQNEQMGVSAWGDPYNGYLHLLPRLIAWIASHVADVAWWPAIYNGLAFAINVALFARLASPRVELPFKAGLMLAFVLVVGTGEVLINVTNLQWVTAFFLLLQLFTRPAANVAQRVGDLAILGIVGLNGPFPIVFWPLFAARAWRLRNADAWLALAVVTLCSATQGWFLMGTPLNLESAAEPFRPLMFLSVIGSRLVTWPLFGPQAVAILPIWAHATLAVGVLGALLGWALRRDEARRPIRSILVAAFLLVTGACVFRVRADTWADDTLVNGDRYFYISRVLVAWLLILEFDARPRAVAWIARGLAGGAVFLHGPHFSIPALQNYQWAKHCDPIRRGVPADIHTLPEGWWIEYPGRQDAK